VSFNALFEILFIFSIHFDQDECVGLEKTNCDFLFIFFLFSCYFILKLCSVKEMAYFNKYSKTNFALDLHLHAK